MKLNRPIFALLVSILMISCISPYSTLPDAFDKVPEEIKLADCSTKIDEVKREFDQNYDSNTEALFNYSICLMNLYNQRFAREWGQLPDLNDGITSKEALATYFVSKEIERISNEYNGFPDDLFAPQKKELPVIRITMAKKEPINCKFFGLDGVGIRKVETDSFENVDSWRYQRKSWNNTNYTVFWQSYNSYDDRDIIDITLNRSTDKNLFLIANNNRFKFSLLDIAKDDIEIFKGIDGEILISNPNRSKFNPELIAMRELVLLGAADNAISAPMQAILIGFENGYYKGNERFFENYTDAVTFVSPIWGDFRGKRWQDYKSIKRRLNQPELFNYYFSSFSYVKTYLPKQASRTIMDRTGDCKAFAIAAYECLSPIFGGTIYTMDSDSANGHTIYLFKYNGSLCTLDNTSGFVPGYKSMIDVNRHFGYPGAVGLRETSAQIFRRFG